MKVDIFLVWYFVIYINFLVWYLLIFLWYSYSSVKFNYCLRFFVLSDKKKTLYLYSVIKRRCCKIFLCTYWRTLPWRLILRLVLPSDFLTKLTHSALLMRNILYSIVSTCRVSALPSQLQCERWWFQAIVPTITLLVSRGTENRSALTLCLCLCLFLYAVCVYIIHRMVLPLLLIIHTTSWLWLEKLREIETFWI
jgi:hypothetical protein